MLAFIDFSPVLEFQISIDNPATKFRIFCKGVEVFFLGKGKNIGVGLKLGYKGIRSIDHVADKVSGQYEPRWTTINDKAYKRFFLLTRIHMYIPNNSSKNISHNKKCME